MHFARCTYSQAICLYLQKSAKSRIRDKNSIAHHTRTTHITRHAHPRIPHTSHYASRHANCHASQLRSSHKYMPKYSSAMAFRAVSFNASSFNVQSERQISSCVGVFLQSERQGILHHTPTLMSFGGIYQTCGRTTLPLRSQKDPCMIENLPLRSQKIAKDPDKSPRHTKTVFLYKQWVVDGIYEIHRQPPK